jgi:hypothetical protein
MMELKYTSPNHDLSALAAELATALPSFKNALAVSGSGDAVSISAPFDLIPEDQATINAVVAAHGSQESVFARARIALKAQCEVELAKWDKVLIQYYGQQALGVPNPKYTEAQFLEVESYKQALRDLPETCADPLNPEWPVPPSI